MPTKSVENPSYVLAQLVRYLFSANDLNQFPITFLTPYGRGLASISIRKRLVEVIVTNQPGFHEPSSSLMDLCALTSHYQQISMQWHGEKKILNEVLAH